MSVFFSRIREGTVNAPSAHEIPPTFRADGNAVVRRCRLDVCEGLRALAVGDVAHLRETRHSTAHVRRIRERFLTFCRKCEGACGQTIARRVVRADGLPRDIHARGSALTDSWP